VLTNELVAKKTSSIALKPSIHQPQDTSTVLILFVSSQQARPPRACNKPQKQSLTRIKKDINKNIDPSNSFLPTQYEYPERMRHCMSNKGRGGHVVALALAVAFSGSTPCSAFIAHSIPTLTTQTTNSLTTSTQLYASTQVTDAAKSESSALLAYELICGDVPWNTLIGEADRSLRLGIELERSGQARAAFAALHEAATLYQCFMDSEDDFAHVTALLKSDCPAVLAYLCIRLGFLNLDALGDANAAVRLYKEASAIDPVPSPFSYEGLALALEASGVGLEEALEAYRKATELDPSLQKTAFNMAVVLDRLGRTEEAEPIFEQVRRSESE